MNTNARYANIGINAKNIFNVLLMLLNCLIAISFTSFLKVMRKMVVGDAAQGVYQGPAIVDFLLRKEFIIIPILLIVFMVVKEFKVKPLKSRVYINLLVTACIIIHAMIVFVVPFVFGLV